MNIEDHSRYKEYHEREHQLYVNYAKTIRDKQKDLKGIEWQDFCSAEWQVYLKKVEELKKELGIDGSH